MVIVGFLLNAPSPDDITDFDLDSVDGSRDVLPFTIAILVAVAVCVALNGLDTSKDVDFGDLMPRNGIAERCLAAVDESAERRDAGSAEKREGWDDSVAEANDAPKEVGDTFKGGSDG